MRRLSAATARYTAPVARKSVSVLKATLARPARTGASILAQLRLPRTAELPSRKPSPAMISVMSAVLTVDMTVSRTEMSSHMAYIHSKPGLYPILATRRAVATAAAPNTSARP
ncbi:MAG TPA: hypothetical protein VN521_08400 [Negativicutes bacterium]|nr:hypothetical protein [Negativicutes bacterium]